MNINKVGLNSFSSTVRFNANKKQTEYENPVSRDTEKNLAVLKTSGQSLLAGVVVGGLTSFLGFKRSIPITVGLVAAALTAVFTMPANVYNTKVSAYARQKEMDVFSRDRSLKTNLTEQVDKEVQDDEVSLDKKLDDNLKLQMANKGVAVGIANVSPHS